MKLSIFCLFGSKTPIHAKKNVLWGGDFTPKMGDNINEILKRHTLARVIKRENPSTALASRGVD